MVFLRTLFIFGLISLACGDARGALTSESGEFTLAAEDLRAPEELRFSNRAACAADSRLPAPSALILVDGFNAAKLVDAWASSGGDTSEAVTVDRGMKLFRLAVAESWMTLAQELLTGRLPLLRGKNQGVSRYAAISDRCAGLSPCAEMERYLAEVFALWKTLPPESTRAQATCLYVKRFSAFQAPWNQDRPDQALLRKVALASLDRTELFTHCFDDSDALDSRRFILQFDASQADSRWWKKNGHDFWYSLKVYFSYAWRHPELVIQSDAPVLQLFRGLAIEQMLQVVSNDCRTIERPECTRSQVSLPLYRAMARLGSASELDRPLPRRPEQAILQTNVPSGRAGDEIIPADQDTSTWLTAYQGRITRGRGQIKQRLLFALANFEVLAATVSSTRLHSELTHLIRAMKTDPALYRKLHVMCAEVSVAADPQLGLLGKRFQTTLESSKFRQLVDASSETRLEAMLAYYRETSEATLAACDSIRAAHLWTGSAEAAADDYSAWYQDLSGTWNSPFSESGAGTKFDLLSMGAVFNSATSPRAPFVVQEKISAQGEVVSSPVCMDATDCARLSLKSMVDLYAVSAWSDALLPVNEWIQSPNLQHGWTEPTSCKVYDPWHATRQATVGLVSDLIGTVALGALPIPGYLAFQPKARQVEHFTLEARGDETFMKPVRTGGGVDVTMGIDLGSLTGIPYVALFTPTGDRPVLGAFYSIGGVGVEACRGKTSNRLVVSESASEGVNQRRSYSGCLICRYNAVSALRTGAIVAGAASPFVRIGIGMVATGLAFAKRMRNPTDVPHRWKVSVSEVEATYEKYTFIPKRCVKRLSQGKSCQRARLTKSERQPLNASTTRGKAD